ncbi:endolytic transglycosylase MltG [Crassaminicella thermophila]|uniref:Endolytic transglycosylase MltG n=1 Tax=Crassaminicella thermophila TaxID=2599308 RepID=A0A5C0SB20_CRATE|nr:endolytic transglycosylase MltG [Crassaminicella thermophila]QEK11775.1 endolytic transglycosylase MltG [Crassaminicella thermophila]
MFEKMKDALYEISDILLAFVIILTMSTIITWKVTDSLAYSKENIAKVNVNSDSNEIKVVEEPTLPIIEEEADSSDSDEEVISKEEDIPSTSVDDKVPADPSPQPTIVHIQIPSGTPGIGIAKILKDKGLIENTTKFISRVEELKIASKLKSGTFDIKTNTSLDDIIYIIAGKKK